MSGLEQNCLAKEARFKLSAVSRTMERVRRIYL
jgi:hypothetical protein